MKSGTLIETFEYHGDVILTCYRGKFAATDGLQNRVELGELEQLVIPFGSRVSLACEQDGTIQIIWSPGHAATARPERGFVG